MKEKNGKAVPEQSGEENRLKAIYEFATEFPGGHTADSLMADERIERIIGHRAWQLVRSGLFPSHEAEDIGQLLRLAVLHEMSKYDPQRDLYVFIGNIVCNYGRNFTDERIREFAKGAPTVSLEAACGETVSGDERLDSGLSSEEKTGLSLDIGGMIATLPPLEQDICRMLMEGCTLDEISSALGRAKSVIHKHIRGGIRKAAVGFGFTGTGRDAQ